MSTAIAFLVLATLGILICVRLFRGLSDTIDPDGDRWTGDGWDEPSECEPGREEL